MAEKKMIPEVRFKGFDGEWEEKVLGDLGYVAMNKRIFKEQTTETGDVPFFKIGTFGGKPDAFISRELFEIYKSNYSYPNEGDILISASGSIGRLVEYLGNDEYFQDSNIIWLQHNGSVENSFLKQFYTIVKWNGLEGSTIKRLYNRNVLDTNISLPTKYEQSHIGTYFQKIDQLIALHQKKLGKLQTLKKAMLSKMFPKDGATTPEIRFNGFEDDWEEKSLGDLGSTYTGLYGKTKDDFGHGKGQFVTYMNVFSNPVSNQKLTELVEIDNSQNEVKNGDVFFTTSSETPEEVGMSSVWLGSSENIYLNSFCFGYRPSLKFMPCFLAQLLRSSAVRNEIIFLAQGISRFNISKTKMMDINISFPTIEEQSRIGNYFQNLDNLISQHQKQLDKLKNIKEACLERMFV